MLSIIRFCSSDSFAYFMYITYHDPNLIGRFRKLHLKINHNKVNSYLSKLDSLYLSKVHAYSNS